MPPKSKISREELIEAAFTLTRQNGFESVTARSLAQACGCSTQPIFHIFENMEELKSELYKKARCFFETIMQTPSEDPSIPLFLNMGLRYLELAQKEKHLFKLLCMSDSFRLESIFDLAKALPLPIDPRLFTKMWVFTHGIASILATNTSALPESELKQLLIEVCLDFSHEGNPPILGEMKNAK